MRRLHPCTPLIIVLALVSSGCLLDSVEAWLSPATIVACDVAIDGKWSVVEEEYLFGSGTEVNIERKPATSRSEAFLYITIKPEKRDTQFVFRATVHDIDGLRFLQIANFTHFDQEIFGLANRPTYSLWRMEADPDNIAIWMPDLTGVAESLKTLRDQNDNLLFVDSAERNEAAIRDWARKYRETERRADKAMMLALTRVGTEFSLPASVERHFPLLYRRVTTREE